MLFLQAIESTCLDLVEEAVDGLVEDISGDAIRQVCVQNCLETPIIKLISCSLGCNKEQKQLDTFQFIG